MNTFYYIFFVSMSSNIYLIKNISNTEAVNIACNFVVLLWRQKCLSETSTSKSCQNTKKQPCRYKKYLARISEQYMDNKIE